MGFVAPDPSNLTYDPYLGAVRMADTGYGTLANPFPAAGYYFYDTSGVLWVVTLDTSGHFVTSPYAPPSSGTYFILGGFMPLPQG